MAEAGATEASDGAEIRTLPGLFRYFLGLGSFGFGGPIALAGYMHRDLVEKRRWYTEAEYQQGLAISQTMPGPLAAQLAMWLGYLERGAFGAFVSPSPLSFRRSCSSRRSPPSTRTTRGSPRCKASSSASAPR